MKIRMLSSGSKSPNHWTVILALTLTIVFGMPSGYAQSCAPSGTPATWDAGKTIISICNDIHSVVKSVDILGMLPDVTLVPNLNGTKQPCTETSGSNSCPVNCGTYKTTTGGLGVTMHGTIPSEAGFAWKFKRTVAGYHFSVTGHVGITGTVDGNANGNVTYTVNCDNTTTYSIHGTVDSTLTLSGGGSLTGSVSSRSGSHSATVTVSMDTPFPGTLTYSYSSSAASATFCVGKIQPTFTLTFPYIGAHNYSGPVLYPGNC
jgi:hypothetical protein